MATETKNKVKFGLNKVYWAKITGYDEDGVPQYAAPVRLPGAVSLSIDANGETEPFYADNCVYYLCNNNSGYEGDLEVALIPTDFATEILGEKLDAKGVLVEKSDAEVSEFALFFEFEGEQKENQTYLLPLLCCTSCNRIRNHRRYKGSQNGNSQACLQPHW